MREKKELTLIDDRHRLKIGFQIYTFQNPFTTYLRIAFERLPMVNGYYSHLREKF